jgi:hypothetical protein
VTKDNPDKEASEDDPDKEASAAVLLTLAAREACEPADAAI